VKEDYTPRAKSDIYDCLVVSGPDRAIGRACMCVPTIAFKLHDLKPRHLAGWFILTHYLVKSEVKVIDQSSRSYEEN